MKHGVWIPSYLCRSAWGGAIGLTLSALIANPAAAQSLDRGLIWSSPPGSGEGWRPNAISIGNCGTQVFSVIWSYDTYSKLLSAHDSGTPDPVWTRTDPAYSTTSSADSAAFDDMHVGMHQEFLSGISGPQKALVTGYRSHSPTPSWEYTMPVSITNHKISKVQVSRDGATVVAYAHDSGSSELEVAVLKPQADGFDPTDPDPHRYTSFPSGISLHGSDLSGDGSILALSYFLYLKIYDTETGTVLDSLQSGVGTGVHDAVAVSGDGTYVARGINRGFQIYRRVGTSNDYVLHFEHDIGVDSTCSALDISDDGSTIVAGYRLTSGTSVRVQAVDIASQNVMADKTFYGAGSYTNLVSDISISADGDYFVAGFYGDGSSSMPELVSFSSASSNPIEVYDQPGSVVDVDISYDGRRFAAAVRDHHVNIGGPSGRLECYNLVDHDLGVVGVPSYGRTVTFQWKTPSSASYAILFRSRELANAPVALPGVSGSLYLPRGGITFLPGSIGPNAIATRDYGIPNAEALVGTSFYFQGYSGNPRTLTEDLVKLTVLP